MRIRHHDLDIELEDSWLAEYGASSFRPSSSSYAFAENGDASLLLITDIEPARRNLEVPYFNDSAEEGLTAKERVVRILRAFVTGTDLPPVEIAENGDGRAFSLTNGVHRLYLSLAVGFTHVPAIRGRRFGDY
jgi:hypothetical protein